ncbi:MAG: hypothetical protein ACTSWK_04375 [Promethearchaeota archaeon]
MQKKEKIFFISIIGFLLIFLTYLYVTLNPDLIFRDNTFISKEMEPPGDLDVILDKAHQYILRIEIQHISGTYDSEFELKLDNETFNILRFYAASSGGRGGSAIQQLIIPTDDEITGEFEIIVKKSEGVRSVEYKIFIDPSEFYIFFYFELGKFLPYFFIITIFAILSFFFIYSKKKR